MRTLPHPHALQTTAALLALAFLLGACASVPGLGSGASRLREKADAAIEAQDFEAAYDHLAELHRRYPESPEDKDAFPLAAALFRKLYREHRFRAPESRWVATEPEFLFEWLATRTGDAFPSEDATALFLHMHYGLFQRFLGYAETDPRLARWEIVAYEDNGLVKEVMLRDEVPEDEAL